MTPSTMFLQLFRPSFCVYRSAFNWSKSRKTPDVIEEKIEKEPIPEIPKPAPLLSRTLLFPPKYHKPREVWIENMDSVKEEKRGLVQLHPEVFATMPRIDLIYANVLWQRNYKIVKFEHERNRAEMPGSGRKPWPQKGLGKARQGSRRAPQWIRGGSAHGPRDPTSLFYMLPYRKRIHGLTSTLSGKFAQDDVRVVDNLDIPTEDSKYILDLLKERHWGLSVLFIDDIDIMPRNITVATDTIRHVNLMPVYGLNVFSMLKHDTLVLTLNALNKLEERLLYHLHNPEDKNYSKSYRMKNL